MVGAEDKQAMKKHLLFFLLITATHTYAQDVDKPKVLILTTGGTIASQTNAPLVKGQELIQAVPELSQYADIEVEEFIRVGSSKMTPEIWLALVKRIASLVEERTDLDCILITHGTDTMEETAFFLQLTHRSTLPIVMVGAMRSSNEISADGPANLLNAVRVGTSPEAVGKGVLVVLNENISSARDLRKAHNRRVDAFQATERGYLGSVDPEKVIFYRSPVKPHTLQSEFDVYDLDRLPPVDIVQDFAGFDQDILDYFLNRSSRGLVISSFAGGRVSNGFRSIFDGSLSQKPTVISSSIRGGRIMGGYSKERPVIMANNLPANKARILLMLALTKTDDPIEIQAIFDQY